MRDSCTKFVATYLAEAATGYIPTVSIATRNASLCQKEARQDAGVGVEELCAFSTYALCHLKHSSFLAAVLGTLDVCRGCPYLLAR